MASTSIQGNWAAQARVFAHDAFFVAVDSVSKIEINDGGTGHALGDIVTIEISAGPPAITFKVEVTDINDSTGEATGVILIAQTSTDAKQPYGKSAVIGNNYNQSATTGAGVGMIITVLETNLVNTDNRGASIYTSVDLTALEVVMESDRKLDGGSSYTTNFLGVKAGSFLPILVKKVVSWTSAAGTDTDGELIAMY